MDMRYLTVTIFWVLGMNTDILLYVFLGVSLTNIGMICHG